MSVLATVRMRAYLPVGWQWLDQALASKPQQIPFGFNIDAQILRHFEDRAGRDCIFEWHVCLLQLLLFLLLLFLLLLLLILLKLLILLFLPLLSHRRVLNSREWPASLDVL